MGTTNPEPTGPNIQLEVLRERQRHSEDRIRELERQLAEAYTNLGRKQRDLEQTRDEYAKLNTKWEVQKNDLQYAQSSLAQNSQGVAKKKTAAKLQAFFASLIFLLSSVLVNMGTSMFTAIPPNAPLAWTLLGLATAMYIIGAFMTTLLALEGGN